MKKFFYYTVMLLLVITVVSCTSPAPTPESDAKVPVDDCYSFAGEQLLKSVEQIGDGNRFPFYTKDDGTWETMDSSWWSSGFFAGCLWLMYEQTSDETWKEHATKWTDGMESEQYNKSDADIGYRIMNSFGNAYRLTGDEHYKDVIIESARSLASRYSDTIGCVKAYDVEEWKFPILVDHMMNIELLFWAARNGGDPEWATMAENHALNTIRTCIREDGSSIQVVDLDPETGEVVGHYTLCGLSGNSAWSRGQGEGIYGFAIAYRETKNPEFLEAAQILADYFVENLPEDNIPYWDFSDPDIPNTIKDSSAASMTADGLLELCMLMDDSPAREKYYNTAVSMLESLCSAEYLAKESNSYGILSHATWKKPSDPGADTSLIWGDYNFMSALMKYKKGL